MSITDEKAIFLSDVACTSYMGAEYGEIKKGDIVAVWGCGPIGLAICKWAKFRGASRVIAIDLYDYRLDLARRHCGAETLNATSVDVVKELQKVTEYGPDVVIDAAGFRFPKSLRHKVHIRLGFSYLRLHLQVEFADDVSVCGFC
jgi:threonine dehydrogenase-like Zn-dependent dehydrogenase